MKNTVIILRGVSGCGKSTFAEAISDENTVICTADDFFMVDGEYKFDPKFLGLAHKTCQEKFETALQNNTKKVVVANTSTTQKEINEYKDVAEEYGYIVHTVVIENRHGNKDVHNVPDTVRKNQEFKLLNSLKLI